MRTRGTERFSYLSHITQLVSRGTGSSPLSMPFATTSPFSARCPLASALHHWMGLIHLSGHCLHEKDHLLLPTPPPQKRLPRAVKTRVCPQCLRKGTGNPEAGALTVSTPGNSVIPQAGHWSRLNFSLFICQVEEGMVHVARIIFSTEVPECLPSHLLTV